jgi:hypothetical protein
LECYQEAAKRQLEEDNNRKAAELGLTLEQYKEQLAVKEAEAEEQRVMREEAERRFLEDASKSALALAKAKEDKESMRKDLVGKRKVPV